MIDNTNLIELLQTTAKRALTVSPYIPNGGCAVYACMITRALRKRKVPCKLRVASYNNTNLTRLVRQYDVRDQESSRQAGLEINHVVVELCYQNKAWLHDTTATKPEPFTTDPTYGIDLMPGYIALARMEPIAATPKGWNPTFNRDTIPAIKQVIATTLGC